MITNRLSACQTTWIKDFLQKLLLKEVIVKIFLQTLFSLLLVTQICFAQWVQTNGPYGGFVLSLAISENNIFTGTWDGIFLSTDNGSSWNAVNNGLTDLYVRALAISGNNIFAGTAISGVWRRPISEMIAVEENKDNLPTEFVLEQNYPNPFNPSTTFRYSIPNESKVIIKVYDILGKEIEALVSEEKPAGTYELTWNAKNLPSGIYFYRIQAGSFIDTKKMILVK
jgi:hypothetical protein